MAATIQTYSVAANYTASAFATAFTSAMTDAGVTLFDSFTNGSVVNRIFEITHDASKTYGKTYLWFMFSGADMFYSICRGWDATVDLPTGTQYIDFLSTATPVTNVTTYHMRFALQNAAQSLNIRRYSSNARSTFNVLLVSNGSVEYHLIIDRTAPNPDIVDLNKVCWDGGLMWARTRINGNVATVTFQSYPFRLRGSYKGSHLRGITTGTQYGANNTATSPWEIGSSDGADLKGPVYMWPGNASGDTTNNNISGASTGGNFIMPVGFNNVNPGGYATDYKPAFHTILLNLYTAATLPSDFIGYGNYTSNTAQTFGGIAVGSDIGEIISVANNTGTPADKPSAIFAALTS
jgi:hypothetical protein